MAVTAESKSRIRTLAQEIVNLLGLRQGNCEIHCHQGRVTQLPVIDKSLKFEDEEKPRR